MNRLSQWSVTRENDAPYQTWKKIKNPLRGGKLGIRGKSEVYLWGESRPYVTSERGEKRRVGLQRLLQGTAEEDGICNVYRGRHRSTTTLSQ